MSIPLAINWQTLESKQREQCLSRPALSNSEALKASVAKIIERVKNEGDKAVIELTKEFDYSSIVDLRLPTNKIVQAKQQLSPQVISAIDLAYDNIAKFHRAQLPKDVEVETQAGVTCQQKHAALETVGLYIPGGTAPLPSTVLMLGVCAQLANCALPVLCTPPSATGEIAPEILYAAHKCSIQYIYTCGGAQAIAAMAYGTQSIPKVDKIFGPGNSFVTQAKQLVSQDVNGAAIDMPAGPSEVLVIADQQANPTFVAADLLSQAEHGIDSQVVLVSNSSKLVEQVRSELAKQLLNLSRQHIAEQALAHSRFIVCQNIQQCIEVANSYAAEHLIIQCANSDEVCAKTKHAGSIFVGAYSPESAGDYASGTNHVLPTYGYSKNYSSLGVVDFMRRYTVQTLSQEGLSNIGSAIIELANAEGLDAHANAVAIRLAAIEQQEACND